MIAAVVASVIIIAVYSIFASSVKARDNAAARSRATLLRTRTTNVIRNDLENALVSGGILAATLQGDSNGSDGNANFPGYLKLTTTGGKDAGVTSPTNSISITNSGTTQMYGDVEQVEYYIVSSTASTGSTKSGDLVRVVTRDLLDATQTGTFQQKIMSGVASMQVAFYDGAQWQPSWQVSGSNSSTSGTGATTSGSSSTSGTSSSGTSATLPEAIRVDIQPVTPPGVTQPPAPVEVLVLWTTTPYLSGTNYSVGSNTSQ